MAVGSWSLDLVPDCPRHVRDEFRDGARGNDIFGSFVVFTESDVHGWEGVVPQSVADELGDAAIYTGAVWERGNKMRRFAGPGLVGMMGNDRGVAGRSGLSGSPTFPANVTEIVEDWFDVTLGLNGIREGGAASPNLSDIAEMLDGSYMPPVKEPLDEVMAQTGNEYYIRPTGYLNWGNDTDLFEHPPKILIVEELSTDVPLYTVLRVPADGISSTEDIYGYRNSSKTISNDYDLAAHSGSGYAEDVSSLGPSVRTWPRGAGATFHTGVIRLDSNDFSDVTAAAQAACDAYSYTNRVITVTADDPCVLASIRPGDWVAIYSPDDNIFDTDNELMVAGQPIHPEWLRSVAVHQPFNPGMGAYVCRYAPTLVANTWGITRITDYIADESGPCTIEIGSKPRPVVPSRYAKYIDG